MPLSVGDWGVAKREAEKCGLKLGKIFSEGLSDSLEAWFDSGKAITKQRDVARDKKSKYDDARTEMMNTLKSYIKKIQGVDAATPEQQKAKDATIESLKTLSKGGSANDWEKAKAKAMKSGLKVDKLFNEDFTDKIIKRVQTSHASAEANDQYRSLMKSFHKSADDVKKICKSYSKKVKALNATTPAQESAKTKLLDLLDAYEMWAARGEPR